MYQPTQYYNLKINYKKKSSFRFLLVIMMVFFLNHKSLGQQPFNNSPNSDSSSLHQNAPYSNAHLNWLNKKGFNTKSYSWLSTEINHQLYDVYEKKTTSNLWGTISTSSLLFGIFSPIDQGNYLRFSAGTAIVCLSQIIRTKQIIKQVEKKRMLLDANTIGQEKIEQGLYMTSPYRPSQNRKLTRMGMNFETYVWNDLKVNLNLNQGFKLRTERNVAAGGALFLLAQGAYIKMLGDQLPIFEGKSYPSEFYLISGLLTGVVLLLHNASKNKFERAMDQYYILIDNQ